jgi:hypothetical protein
MAVRAVTMPAGEPITIITRTKTDERDPDGNRIWDEADALTRPGAFAPAAGSEATSADQDQVTSMPQVLFTGQAAVDVANVVDSNSAIRRANGDVWEIAGEPGDWSNPWTGFGGLALQLERQTG